MRLLELATLLLSFQILPSVVAVGSPGHATWNSRPPVHPPAASNLQKVEGTTDAYLHRLGLGSRITVFPVFSAEDRTCLTQIDFFRRLLAVPGMDGRSGRLILFTKDGVAPAFMALEERNLKVHSIGSFPTDAGSLPTALGSVAILDKDGALLKRWSGFLSAGQQEEVLDFVRRSLR